MSEYSAYIGRFAPSPSGPLHLGSLVAALGSFLQAKSHQGRWLVRIEDIDPPREMAGAAELILEQLHVHGLKWDEPVIFQSTRSEYYDGALRQLRDAGMSYFCRCTRAEIKAQGGHVRCQAKGTVEKGSAIRFLNQQPLLEFDDGHLGRISVNPDVAQEDFVIRRKDGLYAYQLAVVADDIAQGITEVVRGADLLEVTVLQLALYRGLGINPPAWLHLPVACLRPGQKLSKQNHAPALDTRKVLDNLRSALQILGFAPARLAEFAQAETLLEWAVKNWSVRQLPPQREWLVEL
ncbi:tRNA glutamyl-Q(34) synthetase GluQRS [Bowmanella denitrificans]|uniref:tRNA glutamyl-Q(34) synthetase GluQRS n=1 Tax=Bowmanella denitrificans TaxID=366582 RepID=UPI000C9C6BAC|nr:tRNA glutamyl-Q(34) synthetase GluQRS [Bowmanella denitrificans]